VTEKNNFCINCGEELETKKSKSYCHKCGNEQPLSTNESLRGQYSPQKSPGMATLLAFIGGIFGFAGIGHIYVGKIVRGVVILIAGLILYAMAAFAIFSIVFVSIPREYASSLHPMHPIYLDVRVDLGLFAGFIYFIFFIWQIFNARKYAKKFNEFPGSADQ
jgi:hypothetical protein